MEKVIYYTRDKITSRYMGICNHFCTERSGTNKNLTMSSLLRKLFKSKNKENMTGRMRTIASDQEFLGPSQKRNGLNKQSSVHETSGRFIVVEEGGNSYLVEKEESQEEDRDLRTNQNHSGDDSQAVLTLEDLKRRRPPGFQKFEASLASLDLDEEIALELWEDIFKPLYTFDFLKIDSGHLEM